MEGILLFTFTSLIISRGFAEKISQQECSRAFKLGPDGVSCYRAIFDTMAWHDAQKICEKLKSNLASVTSQTEMEFIWDNVISEVFYHHWIGLYKNNSENETTTGWKWIDGTAYDTSWTIWQAGQPKSYDNYALMYMNFAGDWPHWSGETSGATRHVFICEHEIANKSKSAVPTVPNFGSKMTEIFDPSTNDAMTTETSFISTTVTNSFDTSAVVVTSDTSDSSVEAVTSDPSAAITKQTSTAFETSDPSVAVTKQMSTASETSDPSVAVIRHTSTASETSDPSAAVTDQTTNSVESESSVVATADSATESSSVATETTFLPSNSTAGAAAPEAFDYPAVMSTVTTTNISDPLDADERTVKGCLHGFITEGNGKYCYKLFNEGKTWTAAQKTCEAFKSNLVSITSQKEKNFIWDNLVNGVVYYYWIGMYKNTSNNETKPKEGWKWIDGTKYDTSWAMWQDEQPKPDDNYAVFFATYTGSRPHWSGVKNRDTRHKFICKYANTNVKHMDTTIVN